MTTENNSNLDENGFLKTIENPDAINDGSTIEAEKIAISEPPKRKRGRPSNIDKEKIEKGTTNNSSTSKPTKKKTVYTADSIQLMGKQLVGVHLIAAQVTGLAELQINDSEGVALAQGIVLVAEQYDLSIDGKTGAALQLFFTAAMIYGPRILMVNAKMKASKNGEVVT